MKKETIKNNVIIGTLIIIIALMVIVFSPLNSTLKGSNHNNGNKWDIDIISVEKDEKLSTPTSVELEKPTYSGLAFSFYVNLQANDKVVYNVKIKNKGNINGKFKSIFGKEQFNQQLPYDITCEIKKVEEEETLFANTTHQFNVIISRKENTSVGNEPLPKSGTIYFEYNSK